jgi:hypothetical protein
MRCKYCKKKIERHGNARYCPEKNGVKDYCYKQEKRKRQKVLLETKAKIAQIEYQLIGTLEGILQGNKEAKLSDLDFLGKYFEYGLFREYTVNNFTIFKFKNFQLSIKENSDLKSSYNLKNNNHQDEFQI